MVVNLKPKNVILFSLILLTFALSFQSCGGEGGSTDEDTNTTSGRTGTPTVDPENYSGEPELTLDPYGDVPTYEFPFPSSNTSKTFTITNNSLAPAYDLTFCMLWDSLHGEENCPGLPDPTANGTGGFDLLDNSCVGDPLLPGISCTFKIDCESTSTVFKGGAMEIGYFKNDQGDAAGTIFMTVRAPAN